jgi:hypothetical protein
MLTRVVNLREERYDVYIGRPGKGQKGPLGNPFEIGRDGTRAQVLQKHRAWATHRLVMDYEFRLQVLGLRGKTLGCFCRPAACHGDFYVEWIGMYVEILGKRAKACRGFDWAPGMVGRVGDWRGRANEVKDGRVVWHTEDNLPGHTRPLPGEAIPDFDDALTELAMLPLVRKTWQNDRLFVRHFPGDGGNREEWALCRPMEGKGVRLGTGALEVEALVGALECAPSFGRVSLGEPEAFREERE